MLNLADGAFFFVGLAVVGLANSLLLLSNRKLLRPVLTVLALVSIVLVAISSTPLPMWAYALWLIPTVGGLLLGNLPKSPRRMRIVAGLLMLAATAALCWVEAPYHYLPRLVVPPGKTIYVLGDSISAGMGTGERCWPTVLSEITGLSVVNLAEPGATVQSAIRQAGRIAQPRSVVIVEIGGNDLLGKTEADAFRRQIDSLVSSLRSEQHDVLMFELPLFPFQNAFGMAQRDIADKYGVALLPKRFLTKVLGLKGGTLDGLHLSQDGHNALAAIIATALGEQDSRPER
jgi:lysophospholipase L1-like esterase